MSRPPWLHALVLWPEGDTWGGGGRFIAKRKVVLRSAGLRPHPDHPLVGIEVSSATHRSWFVINHLGDELMKVFSPESSGAALPDELGEKEWAGRDYAGHAVYTRNGKLFRRVGAADLEIADFNSLQPDPQPAPESARKPLSPLRRAFRR